MKINRIVAPKTNNVEFCGLNNKILLKGLKFAGENSAIVAAGTTLALSAIVRPISVLLTPCAEKRDKQLACAKSIASSAIGFGLTGILFKPVAKSLNKISAAPEKFLKSDTIKNLQGCEKSLEKSKPFIFSKQILKLTPELAAVVPKALLVSFLVAPIAGIISAKNKDKKSAEISFGSANLTRKLASAIESKPFQRAAVKYQNSNFVQHLLSIKDVFATLCFALATTVNGAVKKEDKKPLILNSTISTALTVIGGYSINKSLSRPSRKLKAAFIKQNRHNSELYKYLNGAKVLKPIVILGSLYYFATPMISTFLADKLAGRSANRK